MRRAGLLTACLAAATVTTMAATWAPLAMWAGSGSKETESFTATAREWRVSWTADPIDPKFAGDGRFVLNVTVMREDGPVSVIQRGEGEKSGVSYVRGAGRYYLKISGANARWTIAAEQE